MKNMKVVCILTLTAVFMFGCKAAKAPDGFVWIPAGTFTMGSPETEPGHNDGETQHEVTLTKGFYMGKYPVTQWHYSVVMESNPSDFKTASVGGNANNLPVEQVSWYDAIVFCNRLSIKEKLTPAYSIAGNTNPSAWGISNDSWDIVQIVEGSNGYRLPTEAQWEYACRAGTTTAFNWGADTISDTQANYDASDVDPNNPAKGLWRERTVEAGSFAPNAFDLYDMHGNVWEWCWDWYGDYDNVAQTDPQGASTGTYRVLRGGDWFNSAESLRSALRYYDYPAFRSSSIGFRLVRP